MRPNVILAATLLAGCSFRPAMNESDQSATTLEAGERSTRVVRLFVDPHTTRAIRGIGRLNRLKYFGLCDPGRDFDQRCGRPERYAWLVRENGITFGRRLGVVQPLVRWSRAVREDRNRPGFADIDFLKKQLVARGHAPPSPTFKRDMGARLDIAAHGHHNAFPEFMGQYMTPQAARDKKKQNWIPQNLDAAAELSAAALKYDYIDFDRPAFYEPVNEPHWSFPGDRHFQQWHLKTIERVHRETPGVQVGGPCLPVAYFYGRQYRSFEGLKAFIAGTGCRLDFYSFHCYDYLRAKNGDFGGRITSGLPLESVLDLIENYTWNAFGKEVGIVVSEHGGYGGEEPVDELAHRFFPGEGFEWEMKKRSIDDFNMVSSVLANTLVFMDHPHVVRKAVPFILLHSMAWNPRYYSVLYVPYEFRDKSRWVPTKRIFFYRFLRDLRGRRVKAFCPDPDIQARVLANGNTLFVVANNLSRYAHTLRLDCPRPERIIVRRLGRNPDFTPYLTEQTSRFGGELELKGREAILLKMEYARPVAERATVNEIPCYGDAVAKPAGPEAVFSVAVPHPDRVDYAVLRVGVSRPAGSGCAVRIVFNGREVAAPIEDCALRLEDEKQGYATCRVVRLDPSLVREQNEVRVSFPDGKPGSVGAVIIRAGCRVEGGGER